MSIPRESRRNPRATKRTTVSAKQREQLAKDKRQASIEHEAQSFVRVVRAHITDKTFKASVKAQLKSLLVVILGKSLVKATKEEKLVAKTSANKAVYKNADETVNRDTLKTFLTLGHKALGMPLLRVGVRSTRNSNTSNDNATSSNAEDSSGIDLPIDITEDQAQKVLDNLASRFDLDRILAMLQGSVDKVHGKRKFTIRLAA